MKTLVCIISSLFVLTIAKTAFGSCGCNKSKAESASSSETGSSCSQQDKASCSADCNCSKHQKGHSCHDNEKTCGCNSEKKGKS